MHLLPADELRRQYDNGEITRDYYEAMRDAKQPDVAENLCSTPHCTRQAYRIDRGKAVCAVCFLRLQNARRRGW